MNLNIDIVLEALGLPGKRWHESDATKLDITHFEILTPKATEQLDPHVLYLTDERTPLSSLADTDSSRAHIIRVAPAGESRHALSSAARNAPILVEREGGLAELVNDVAKLFADYNAWDERLVRCALDEADLTSYLDIGQEALGVPVSLFGVDSSIIGVSTMEFDRSGDFWKLIDKLGYIPFEKLQNNQMDTSFVRNVSSGRMSQQVYDYDPAHIWLESAVMREGTVFGWFSAIGPKEGLTRGQASLFRHLRDRLQDSPIIRQDRQRNENPLTSVIDDLASGWQASPEDIINRLDGVSHHINSPRVVAGFVLSDDFNDPQLAASTLKNNVSLTFQAVPVIRRGDVVCAVFEIDDCVRYPIRLIELLEQKARTWHCCCILSTTCRRLIDIRQHFEQIALTAQVLDPHGPCQLIRFEDMYDRVLTEHAFAHHTAAGIYHPLVETLAQEYGQYGLDLIACLEAYIECNASTAHAAEILYTHRNTVNKRIRKIEDMLGRPLRVLSPSERLHLLLSCKMALRNQ